jgi:hypothetical protein
LRGNIQIGPFTSPFLLDPRDVIWWNSHDVDCSFPASYSHFHGS